MPLRFASRERVYPIDVDGTIINLKSLSIIEKERLARQLSSVNGEDSEAFKSLLKCLAPAIVSIEGFQQEPIEVLEMLEYPADLKKIMEAIMEHCSLSLDEEKNSDSSLG